jgi:phosphate-selective porin OprO/OprP
LIEVKIGYFRNSFGNGDSGPANRYPTFNPSGFLQIDTGWLYQDEVNKAAVGEVTPSTGLRRVRLRADGNIQEATSYVIDLDFAASGHPSFRNVGLTFHEVPVLQNLELGLLKTPFGMDAMTSGRELLFMERQLPFAIVPFRQIMIGARGTSDEKTVSCGGAVYRMPTDSFGVYEGGSGGIAAAGRVSSALFYEDEGATVLHLGGGYSVGSPGDGAVRYRIQPGFFSRDPGTDAGDPGTVPVFLDTGDISATAFQLFDLEAGMNFGPLHVVSEMRWSNVIQNTGPNLTFPGFYVQASYVLTGENHRYSREHGVFQRVIPNRPFERGKGTGFGALEAAIGYSMLDLNQHNIAGGRGDVLAMGLNWYLTRNAKFQLNVLPGTLMKPGFDESHITVTAMRVQVEF